MIAPSLLAEVQPLAERFVTAGHRIYLVGGVVRDQLLGRPIADTTDLDLTTDAGPDAIKRAVAGLADAVWSQGERFGTIGCRIGSRDYEITSHRGESYEPHSRKPSVVFSSQIEHDLERRDFTVNAMAFELPAGELIDPFHGRDDLRDGVLRTPLAPEVSFSDDPLRMLRAARFLSGYGLVPEPTLVDAIAGLTSRMAIVSIERRRDELDKLLSVEDPTGGFRFLRQHDLIRYMVPGLAESSDIDFDQAMSAVQRLPRARLRLAALIAASSDARADAERQVRALRYGNEVIAEIGAVVHGAAMIRTHRSDWADADVRRLAAATGDRLDDAVTLASTHLDTQPLRDRIELLRSQEDLGTLALPLDGDVVMRLLGIEPGVEVGRALAFIRDLRIREGPIAPTIAADRLAQWWSDQPRD